MRDLLTHLIGAAVVLGALIVTSKGVDMLYEAMSALVDNLRRWLH